MLSDERLMAIWKANRPEPIMKSIRAIADAAREDALKDMEDALKDMEDALKDMRDERPAGPWGPYTPAQDLSLARSPTPDWRKVKIDAGMLVDAFGCLPDHAGPTGAIMLSITSAIERAARAAALKKAEGEL